MDLKVGDVIYQLQYKLHGGEITGVLSIPHTIKSIDEKRKKVTVVDDDIPLELVYSVSLFDIEHQTLLCRAQQSATNAITEQYMWTVDVDSGARKMIESSIQSCNEIIKQFSDLNQRLFDIFKNNMSVEKPVVH